MSSIYLLKWYTFAEINIAMSAVSAFAARKAQAAAAESTGSPQKETPSSQAHSQTLVPQVKNNVLTRNTKRGKSGQAGNALPAMGPDFIAEGNGPGEDSHNHISRCVCASWIMI